MKSPPARKKATRIAAISGGQTVRRALAVLRLVATAQEHGIRLTDIVAMSGLSRPTTHRLLKVLIDETVVEQIARTHRYRIGSELPLLGLARGAGLPIRAIAEPYLRALADEVGDTIFLSVRHGADSVCIARYLGNHGIQVLSIDVGVRRPLGLSVSGMVLLAGLEWDLARSLTRTNASRLVRLGRTPAQVRKLVRSARAEEYVHAVEGVMPGTSAIAVPLRDADGCMIAAISMAALADRLNQQRLTEVLAKMRTCATIISQRNTKVQRRALV
ncbi:MAG: IclR family transcriptional regulator [Pseudomonadota bacterium]|nr:IclR family transcriptional regulator [Pseudomonadota bacterium]